MQFDSMTATPSFLPPLAARLVNQNPDALPLLPLRRIGLESRAFRVANLTIEDRPHEPMQWAARFVLISPWTVSAQRANRNSS